MHTHTCSCTHIIFTQDLMSLEFLTPHMYHLSHIIIKIEIIIAFLVIGFWDDQKHLMWDVIVDAIILIIMQQY
jgi:hypothetical protein